MQFTPRVLLAALLIFTPLAAGLSIERSITCNGHTELCARSYSNVTYVGAHDSFAVDLTGNNVAANQDFNVTQQLNDGIRLLQNQVLSQPDGLHLCHTICPLYDAGLLLNYLKAVKSWMDENVNEVVTILLVNINNEPAEVFAEVYEAAGLSDVSYSPTSSTPSLSDWPTLGTMIASGQRLVSFLDNGANFSTAPYLIDEFTNVWETAFDVTTQDWLCDVNRTRGDPTTKMYLINHFLDEDTSVLGAGTTTQPAKDKLNVTNAATGDGSLGFEIQNCVAQHGVPPNYMLVDFYEYGGGSVFDVAASLNGVSPPVNRPPPPPTPQADAAAAAEAEADNDDGITVRPLNSARGRKGSLAPVIGIVLFLTLALAV